MFGLPILDLVIGLIFIYFLLSLVCSAIQEIIANIGNLRFKVLEQWMLRTFHLNGFGRQILDHPVIQGLTRAGRPSYIPSDKFAQVVLDVVHSQVKGDRPLDINSLRDALEKTILIPPGLKRFILQSIVEGNGQITKVRTDLAKWYDDAMERVTGFYKKKTQESILVIALIVVAIFNADSIRITKYLYDNPEAAKQLADQASRLVMDSTIIRKVEDAIRLKADSLPKESTLALKEIQADLNDIKTISAKIYDTKLPLGWVDESSLKNWTSWLEKMGGLLLTALAVSLGAPFWFELLSKLVNLRNAGAKPKPVEQDPL